mmetsp:Transcript_28104/g.76250  ORF Transcript_28104/g.76250 Transcript_28104/m.76250 type:complete len:165 (-) Transcript_28104:274-768(-)|eukprot:CAMPEP_0172365596 /NCGR_PEP_ID=MMETSP1060-20121228/10535_1 /TAXON_ID=37318 /ORGANISM="Pseudo-nitzschia pungens, Strain cf. cingulata" /LENGTH=164 /DNA_ID=CAMNT_0013088967 /DNA_START=22 /DNA_END=516 /DNA_ORIENTATION=-
MNFIKKVFPPSKPLPRPPVPEGVTRICVSGFGISHHTGRARAIATAIAEAYPDKYETWYYFDSLGYRPEFLESVQAEIKDSGAEVFDHTSSPFCWFEESSEGADKKTYTAVGGRDRLAEWATKTFAEGDAKHETIRTLSATEPSRAWSEIKFDSTTPGTAKTGE